MCLLVFIYAYFFLFILISCYLFLLLLIPENVNIMAVIIVIYRFCLLSLPSLSSLLLFFLFQSRFYSDPVIVLDFQSLYPSIVIAYNLCFSTIMGKVLPGSRNPAQVGVSESETTGGFLIVLNDFKLFLSYILIFVFLFLFLFYFFVYFICYFYYL